MITGSVAMTPLAIFFEVLAFAAFVVEGWAFIDAARRPAAAFVAVGSKLTKALWLVLLGASAVVGLGFAVYVGGMSVISILPVGAFVAAAIYLAGMRPKVREFRGGSAGSGPYGPW